MQIYSGVFVENFFLKKSARFEFKWQIFVVLFTVLRVSHSISVLLHSTVKYRRIFPVESLSKVENPWKGFTLNRCILVAMVIVVVSSTVEIVQGEFSNVCM